MLLRLENQFQADESAPSNMNTDVTVDAKVLWNKNTLVARIFLADACNAFDTFDNHNFCVISIHI